MNTHETNPEQSPHNESSFEEMLHRMQVDSQYHDFSVPPEWDAEFRKAIEKKCKQNFRKQKWKRLLFGNKTNKAK